MKKIAAIVLLLASCVRGAAEAESSWLTSEQQEASARELVDRMREAGFQQISPPNEVLAGARTMIQVLRVDIETRGEAGLSELAPGLDDLGLPGSGSALLDRMGGFNLCFVALSLRIRDPAIHEDDNARLAATLGSTASELASRFFRHRFLGAGGEEGDLRSYSADEGRLAVFNGLFRDARLRTAVLAACEPAVRELVASALRSLVEGALFGPEGGGSKGD